ncbi:MAG: hypothetical protein JXQ90_04940 [Cyclobacteriaceae bacterium]
MVYREIDDEILALRMLRLGAKIASEQIAHTNVAWAYRELSKLYIKNESTIDSAIYYAQLDVGEAHLSKSYLVLRDAFQNLADIYVTIGDYEKAYQYEALENIYSDSLQIVIRDQALIDLEGFDLALKNLETEKAASEYQSKLRTNIFLGSSSTLLVVVLLIYRNNRNQRRSKEKVEKAYTKLQSTQSQLIHSEKMASLGELTAGIAHEIQNPLNFVNNFSEVNKELAEEMIEEMKKGNFEEAEIIGKDLIENESKVSHHGKRAEGIVRSMLQHSRTGSGEKELTDINALCDEYLRLAYHGFKAKDSSFSAEFKLELDESLPKINVVPQDMGRVLLNLINNAFQAVSYIEKPLVTVSTKSLFLTESSDRLSKGEIPLSGGARGGSEHIQITISDNGPGIHDDIKDKIFEPFFTTKPTGEGTGLGLSMSYDIVTKGHGGHLVADSKEGHGTAFVTTIPLL